MSENVVYFRKGKHVGLSIPEITNIPFYMEAMNNPEIANFLGRCFPVSQKEQEQWFQRLHKNRQSHQVFNITLLEGDVHIGVMGLHNINFIDGTATTGAWMTAPEHGKGFGTEAKLLLLRYAFYTLRLRKIRSTVIASNKRSIRYNEKCGYFTEGVLEREIYVDGELENMVMMAVFKENFDPIWEAYMKTREEESEE